MDTSQAAWGSSAAREPGKIDKTSRLLWNHCLVGTRSASSGVPDVSTVIAEVAKQILAPLGVKRKGRSRTWLDDHGWWLGIVEFQPSRWGAGSYLNVGPMFLWQPISHLVLEGRYRLDDFSPADHASSFRQAIQAKAAKAKDELTILRKRFASLRDVTRHYQATSTALSMSDHAHLGTVWGLLGEMERCRSALDSALLLREQQFSGLWRASAWMVDARQAAADERTFRTWTLTTLNATRAALKLPEPVKLPEAA
jgi:hypothetical protein